MNFDYYYGAEAEQFLYVKLPKVMLFEPAYNGLSDKAKIMYGILRDKMCLSLKNGWIDEFNRVYIIYSVEDIMEDFNISKRTTINYMNELSEFGLIEKKRRGFGLPNLIYVKNFALKEVQDFAPQEVQDFAPQEVQDSAPQEVQDSAPQEVQDSAPQEVQGFAPQKVQDSAPLKSKTDKNKTNIISINQSNNKTNINNNIYKANNNNESPDANQDDVDGWIDIVKENISYDDFMASKQAAEDKALFDNLFTIICDVICDDSETIRISGQNKSTELVKKRFMKLNQQHLLYVIDSIKNHSNDISRNKLGYFRTCLYNASATGDLSAIKSTKSSSKKQNNIMQRNYSSQEMSELERKLLNRT